MQAKISNCGKVPMRSPRLFLNPFRELSRETKVLDWTCSCGVGDWVGDVVSIAGDGVGEVACGAGNIAPPDISNLRCLWPCSCSSPAHQLRFRVAILAVPVHRVHAVAVSRIRSPASAAALRQDAVPLPLDDPCVPAGSPERNGPPPSLHSFGALR